MTDAKSAPERVTVNKSALEAFIAYADETRIRCDSQFLCSVAEGDASDAEFGALVDALTETAPKGQEE